MLRSWANTKRCLQYTLAALRNRSLLLASLESDLHGYGEFMICCAKVSLRLLRLTCGTVVMLGGLVFSSGCGSQDGPTLGSVYGKVTLEGEPLAGVIVNFSPENGGRASFGVTDDDGNYQLRFSSRRKGALPGQHRVRIHPNGVEAEDVIPEEEWESKVPQHYSGKSYLNRSVEKGSNEINLELVTDPAASQVMSAET